MIEIKEQEFKTKKFKVVKGLMHPDYSYFTFDEEEKGFRDKYWNIKNGDVVFDIGASYGSYSLTACVSGAQVYSFEPEPAVFAGLIDNIRVNNWLDEITAFNYGFWSSEKEIDMSTYAPHWPKHTITKKYIMNTLDQFIIDNNINKIDWIKIDVEGAEEEVLKGGIELIKKFSPNIIIECHNFLDKNLSRKVKNLLSSLRNYIFEEVNREPCVMIIAKIEKETSYV